MKRNLLMLLAAVVLAMGFLCKDLQAQTAENFDTYYDQGYELLLEESYPEAITNLEQALSLNPKSIEANLALGVCYRELKDLDKALELTQNAIKMDSKYYPAYYNLGIVYEQRGELDQAYKAYKTFYDKVPGAKDIPSFKEKLDALKASL